MSWTLEKIRRKKDRVVLFDLINDSCDMHNIFDIKGDLVESEHGSTSGISYDMTCLEWSEYERAQFDSNEEYKIMYDFLKDRLL